MDAFSDGLGFQPRIGEPETSSGGPQPLAGGPSQLLGPNIPDTSISGPGALQAPNWWVYDFDPGTGSARATFNGEVNFTTGGAAGTVSSWNSRTGAVVLTAADVAAVGALVNPSVGLTGVPTTPTAVIGTSTTQVASTAFVEQAIVANPAGFQTAAQVTASLANYLPLSGGTMNGPLIVNGNNVLLEAALPKVVFHYTDNSNLGEIGYQGTATMGFNNASAATWLYLWNDASFSYFGGTGIAVKTGGGSWTAASDARIKTVEGAWTLGLDEVLRLEPVVYRYKGNDAEPGKTSAHAQVADTGQPFVGLIAQAVETVFPNMVTQGAGWIDGAEVDDFRNLDPSSLVYALINAVKTLAARVAVLEGA